MADSPKRTGAAADPVAADPAVVVMDEKAPPYSVSVTASGEAVSGGGNTSSEEKAEALMYDEKQIDIFSPLPDLQNIEPEPMPLTTRAVVVGLVLGSLVNASNVYLGMCVIVAFVFNPLFFF